MTSDEHYKLLGKLVGNFQSLEFILRMFLQLASARPIGIPYGTNMYSSPVGAELPECAFTSYDTLGALIKKFNTEMDARRLSTIDVSLVVLRDALAHGRVSSSTPDGTMRLLKFSEPKKGRVRVVFNQEMTKAWFDAQIERVREAIRAVSNVMPQ